MCLVNNKQLRGALNLGYLIRTLRISAGMSLREMARIIGVSPAYLSLVENGKQPPPNSARIARIEEALKVPLGFLQLMERDPGAHVSEFVQKVPEALDFLSVAKKSAMSSKDFAKLSGFLNTYGWNTLKQAMEAITPDNGDSSVDPPARVKAGPYIWPFLEEGSIFDVKRAKDKAAFLQETVRLVSGQCGGTKPDLLLRELFKREKVASTGIGKGVAVPHAYVDELDHMVVALFRIPDGLDFDSIDGEPVYLALLLAGPRSSRNLHLQLLARMAKLLRNDSFCENVLAASSPGEVIAVFKMAELRIP